MTDEPLVSILMPVRDAGPFLEECLNSIQEQTYTHWELLAVDDRSGDQSLSILESYALDDSRIKVSKNPGEGIVDALNHAFEHSSGTYISRMDADDIMPREKIETLLNIALNNDGIATGMVTYFSEKNIGDGYTKYTDWLNTLSERQTHYEEIFKECVVASPAWLTSRKILETCGGIAVKDVYPEDYDLVFRWRKHGFPITASDQLVHLWRDHDMRASRNDPNYADNAFLELKLRHFVEDDLDSVRPLVIWGAGAKGKATAQWLKERGHVFIWVTDNTNKIGHEIYGNMLESSNVIAQLEQPQIIVVIAQPEGQEQIKAQLKELNETAYWFC